VLTDLGTVDGDACSGGLSINSANQIVGVSFACDQSVAHGFLWEEGQIVDLNTLVPTGSDIQLQLPYDINDEGEIAGFGASANGDSHAFLLIPCDNDHPGIEGCDYSMVEANKLASPPSPVTSGGASSTLPQYLMRRMNRYRFPGLAARPRN
jgi:probable HAF family extracellular repeat protein